MKTISHIDHNGEEGYWVDQEFLGVALESMVTVASIVRCDDCVHIAPGCYLCEKFNVPVHANDYCSQGEKEVIESDGSNE